VQKFEHKHLWSYNENELDIAPTGMVLAYQDDEIDQTFHDVTLMMVSVMVRRFRCLLLVRRLWLQPLKLTQF
jgi:hypothetical protein